MNIAVTNSVVITIEEPEDAYYVAQEARHLAFELGFSDFDIGMITIAVAEITTNVVRYALPGIATLKKLELDKGIEVTIEDNGPGISDLEQAMVDGFSTHCEPSIGKGLGSANRCVEEFIVNKTDSNGTSITLRHYLPLLDNLIEKIGISFPAVGLHDNGDQYCLKQYQGDKLFACVIDGAGKGANAAVASQYALGIAQKHYRDSFDSIIKQCHCALKIRRPFRPVQMALLRLTPDSLEFCAIGDVGIKIIADSKESFAVHDGSVGLTLPKKIHIHQIDRPKNLTVFLHSDGVVLPNDINLDRQISLERSSCQLYNQVALANDDATLIVIRDKL
ncbi:Anti-sigma F factor [Pseudoalteromonas holothuriae]|uniref:Anti-sigma F factor n=1 Tax=Pseudoalteromonas holothuriae TaxID=2963714 RepID=A0ABM9GEE7_9GAMM|nr:ATP-binding protein [Pseudoalteromonas sp. CIP111951]CAH9052592.1 Anti-sigma F factor [Pseudoalteromonas sp. CIP111951]